MSETISKEVLLELSVGIVSSFIASKPNEEEITDFKEKLPELLIDSYRTLSMVASHPQPHLMGRPKPAVAINQSYTNDYIICLEDGKKLQMLKRHLKTMYNMSLDDYKKRWALPMNYPTVCADYSRRRSEIAKTSGLGIKGRPRKISLMPNQYASTDYLITSL